MIRLVLVSLLLAPCSLLQPGCSSTAALRIPAAPAWQQPADARPITGAEAMAAARRVAPLAAISASDSVYTRISHAWLERFVSWTWEAAKAAGIHYTPESFDCENFTNLFAEIVAKKAGDAGVRAAPLTARLVVTADGGGRHALLGVATDRGLFIVEPQPDAGPFRIKPLASYDQRILAVMLGGLNP